MQFFDSLLIFFKQSATKQTNTVVLITKSIKLLPITNSRTNKTRKKTKEDKNKRKKVVTIDDRGLVISNIHICGQLKE
jgi:hypothetical protein